MAREERQDTKDARYLKYLRESCSSLGLFLFDAGTEVRSSLTLVILVHTRYTSMELHSLLGSSGLDFLGSLFLCDLGSLISDFSVSS